MGNQRTLVSSFKLQGITLHSGTLTNMTVHAARPNKGIVFRRVDTEPAQFIKATVDNVSNTERCTQLMNEYGYTVSMVEHILSALRGMGVDNAIIDLDGAEIPVLDGSAALIAARIAEVGLLEQQAPLRYYHLTKVIRVQVGRSFLTASPYEEVSYMIGFRNDHHLPFLADQTAVFHVAQDHYASEVAAARTFGYETELDGLRAKGLIKGASTDNAVLIGKSGILSDLRYENEFARHKLLDVIGDLALVPPFLAKIEGERTSHYLNMLLAREIAAHIQKE
ncbi:UDP-3-O-acyl-N-acetylglucosamine deacetylase [Paenibacillus sp. JCM 10914]|uniref:UDP-3-O-acyl-N-acetylglucosamine deacetylase n=1 Tax=Paenibacillus sp. JCM 10914 TaxID=1236974 RepID=UPI0003CCA602|nr:UDP-3-O-acyl-N-acetylglucosamine deacetylase [Paenibacillus sp. JCM 10914]GAE07850.1 nitrite reductase [Paenibacillus sp. JCM 10914]